MNEMNVAQCAASRHRDGPALVLAGPGSGKTYTLVKRLEFLISECNTDPSSILTLTFTNQAANEMKSRAMSLMGQEALTITFGTFHSVFYYILKNSFSINSSNILKAKDRYMILSDIARRLNISTQDMRGLAEDMASMISRKKNGADTAISGSAYDPGDHKPDPSCIGQRELDLKIYELYEKSLRELGLIDFDDMIIKCRSLFQKDEMVLRRWQERYRYIQIDEFQDINRAQYDVIRLLAGEDCNIFAVGDDDQSIYGFRGAGYGIMQDFLEDHPDAVRYELDINYRCPAPIADAADIVISQNKDRIKKDHSSFVMTGALPDIRSFCNRREEIQAIKESILTGGVSPCDCVVLVRSRLLADLYCEELQKAGIPTQSYGRSRSVYDTETSKDVMAYMRLAAGNCSREDILRIMNKPMRYLSREAFPDERSGLDCALKYYKGNAERIKRGEELIGDIERMGRLKPQSAVRYLMKVAGYERYALSEGRDKSELEKIMAEASKYSSVREWVQSTSVRSEEDRKEEDAGEKLKVMTLHAPKGLEFKEVFLADINADIMPGRSTRPINEVEEERRLLYVGMTRAISRLHIFSIHPSPFLTPITGVR